MVWRIILTLILFVVSVSVIGFGHSAQAQDSSRRLVTVYDRGVTKVFLTKEKTIGDALRLENIELDAHDAVEPTLKQGLVASSYKVNIYRARPVVVVDGAVRIKTVSAYQTAQQIAKDVGITINDEDTTTIQPLTDFVNDGAGLQLTIHRAITFSLDLYGKKTDVRTKEKTVGAMLKAKGITVGPSDRVSLVLDAPITAGLEVRVWREGKQTISVDQAIPVSSRIVYDADQPIGYRVVQTKGVPGIRTVSYQIEVKDGLEISRIEIANIVTHNATEQIEVIGLRNDGAGLTKNKGAQFLD